jgi:hypothetical protein
MGPVRNCWPGPATLGARPPAWHPVLITPGDPPYLRSLVQDAAMALGLVA